MLRHEIAFRRLLDVGFITPDYVGHGAVWIAPTPAGLTHLCQQRARS